MRCILHGIKKDLETVVWNDNYVAKEYTRHSLSSRFVVLGMGRRFSSSYVGIGSLAPAEWLRQP